MVIQVLPQRLRDPDEALQAPEAGAEASLIDILIVLAERKRILLQVGAAFAVTAIIVSLPLPKRYTAPVTRLTPQQPSPLSGVLGLQLGHLTGVAALVDGRLSLKNPRGRSCPEAGGS